MATLMRCRIARHERLFLAFLAVFAVSTGLQLSGTRVQLWQADATVMQARGYFIGFDSQGWLARSVGR